MVRVAPGPGMSRLGPNIIGIGTAPAAAGIPGGGMTLDALIARQKQLSGQQIPLPEMTSPMQGVGYVAQQVMQGLNQGHADRDLRQGREALAQALTQFNPDTGEFTPEATATIGALDPDKMFTVLHDLAERRRLEAQTKGEREFRTSERVGTQEFEAGQNQARIAADDARQRLQDANADGRQEDAQQAQQDLAVAQSRLREQEAGTAATRASTAADEAVQRSGEKIGVDTKAKEAEAMRLGLKQGTPEWDQYVLGATPDKTDQWGPVPASVAQAQGGDVGRNPSAYRFNSRTGEVEPLDKAAKPADIAATQKLNSQLIETRGQLKTLQRAQDLVPNVFEGFGAKERAATVVNTKGVGVSPETLKQAQDTLEFYRIMDLNALTTMSRTLSGSDSNRDVENFLRILSDPSTTAQQKQQQIQGMQDLGSAYERTQADAIRQSGGDPDQLTVGGGSSAAPGDGAGAGSAAQEGDIAVGPDGKKIIVRNGKWEPYNG